MLRKLLAAAALFVALAVVLAGAAALWLRSDAVRSAIEQQAASALGMRVRISGARATVFPRLGVDLRQVVIGEPARARVDRLSIATGLGVIFTRRVEAADVELTGGQIDMSLLAGIAALSAPSDPTGDEGSAGAPITIVSIASIRLRDVDIIAGAERIRTSLDASLAGDRMDLNNLSARVRDAELSIRGQMSSVARREGHFVVHAQTLPIDALVGALHGLAGSGGNDRDRAEKTASPARITATISAPIATLGHESARSFEARLDVTPTGFVLQPLTFDIDRGRFDARVALDVTRQGPMLDIRGKVSGVDVTRFASPAARAGNAVTGELGATFTLQAPARSGLSALLEVARGPMELNVRDGRMPGIQVIRETVIRFANRALPAPQVKATDTFSRLDASLLLQDGVARINRLTMNAADFDLAGTGTLALPANRIALEVELTLSEALSKQAGRDLYRYARDGRRIVLPATIGGTLADPTATIDVAKAAKRAIRNRIEDEMRSLLDRAIRRNRPPDRP
jgi:uncharacterized protein involved in outer membrane biogenesis